MDINIRANNEILAAYNYKVFVPDLFWKDLPGYELNSINDTDINESLTKEDQIEKEDIKEIMDSLDSVDSLDSLDLPPETPTGTLKSQNATK